MSRSARALMVGGVVAAVFGFSKLHASRIAPDPYDFTNSTRFAWAIAYVVVLLVCAYGLGLPDLARSRRRIALLSFGTPVMAALVLSAATLSLGTGLLPRFVVFGAAMVLVPWFWLCADLAGDTRVRAEERDRVIVVGSWSDAAELTAELERGAERPARIVDVISPSDVQPRVDDAPLRDLVRTSGATVLVLDRDAQVDPVVIAQVASLHEEGVRIRTLSLFYEEWLGKLPVSELERVSLMFDIGEVHRARYSRQRRLLDVGLGLAGLVLLAVVTPCVVMGNLVANRGPLLYRQQRVGQDGRVFTILKFRSMRPATDDDATWTSASDPRITPFGAFLRRSHLDELPQVLNVLRGDLAIVGPRPEQPHYVEELAEKLPFYRLRHLARPGMTGWAQVKYGYAGSESDALEKLQYEFYYLRYQGIAFDMRIVLRTMRSVLGGAGT